MTLFLQKLAKSLGYGVVVAATWFVCDWLQGHPLKDYLLVATAAAGGAAAALST